MGGDAAKRASPASEEPQGRDELSSAELFDVPAAVVCATCGDPGCAGCAGVEEPTHGSGVVAIIPWERPGEGALRRFWNTAKLATTQSTAFFAALPDGEVLPALRFAILAELVAATGLCAVAAAVLLAIAPGALDATLADAAFRDLVLRAVSWGIPTTAVGMVAVHALHGAGLDFGARRMGSTRRSSRGLRFGLYACAWDLLTLPVGLLLLALDEGPRAALKAAPLALTVPSRAAMAYLRGVHRLDETRAHEAARFAVAVSAALVFATIFSVAAGVVLYAVL